MSDDAATMSNDACQSQIKSTIGWIESSRMDRVKSDGLSQVMHCMHALAHPCLIGEESIVSRSGC
jgi:hypothetical protein